MPFNDFALDYVTHCSVLWESEIMVDIKLHLIGILWTMLHIAYIGHNYIIGSRCSLSCKLLLSKAFAQLNGQWNLLSHWFSSFSKIFFSKRKKRFSFDSDKFLPWVFNNSVGCICTAWCLRGLYVQCCWWNWKVACQVGMPCHDIHKYFKLFRDIIE